MIDITETWKKHGWVPPSQQEKYTNYWESVKNPPPRMKVPEIHILETESRKIIFSEDFLKNNTCRF